ncbi:hypothetical protein [Amycolatopsis alba]|uniref:Uncharacterized protein n=1 Tax=Amycolatopsis alba DSM 44262 TaxID=1125972 RepID=A0A229S6L9_AMYAL|nr:hypothetical protein [Amycolatopsis alba]OXM54465.1 hypothetical protein CFP75_05195 [Amycolatopsis alba DSM 44262]
MTAFPPLPAPGDLVPSEPVWSYPATARSGGYAHLRLFTVPGGGHLALVTDPGLGTSVTNAAEHIHAALTSQYGEPLWMIEHYPAARTMPDDGETLDLVDLVGREPVWRQIWPPLPRHRRRSVSVAGVADW